MKNRESALFLLTRILRIDADAAETNELEQLLSSDQTDWESLIRVADKALVTGALAASLRRRDLHRVLPMPVQAALDRRNMIGSEINRRIRRQAKEAVRVLNDIGCTPLIFKGALHLFEASPEDLGARMMRDLDIVVPEDRLEDCIAALRRNGYVPEQEADGWTYHYHAMHHKDHLVGIELHFFPGEQRDFLPVEEVWREAIPVDVEGLKVVAPGPSHRIAHNIFHSEIQDSGYFVGELCLRQLYDLAKTCAIIGDKVDWEDCLARFERYGFDQIFRARMYAAQTLLGAPDIPVETANWRSRIHLNFCFYQTRSPRLLGFMRGCAGIADRLSRYHIDLHYKCGTSGSALQWYRIKHIWRMLRQYRGDFGKRVAEHGRRLQRER